MNEVSRPITSAVLLTHTVLVGLTPLIPVPFLDDAVKAVIERRLVRSVASSRSHTLDEPEVRALTEEPGGSLLWSIGKGVVLFPFKLIFRKLFVVLEIKRASDEASKTYHRGLLLDFVLREGMLAPEGVYTPAQVRRAMEAVVAVSSVSPIGRAMAAAFEGSRKGFAKLARAFFARLGKDGAVTERRVERAVDDTAEHDDGPLAAIVQRLASALDEIPQGYFEELERRFTEQLESGRS